MATVTFIKYKRQTGGTLRSVAQYVSQAKKTVAQTGHPLASGLNCTPRLAAQEFIATRKKKSPGSRLTGWRKSSRRGPGRAMRSSSPRI